MTATISAPVTWSKQKEFIVDTLVVHVWEKFDLK
jgi:hypothetical protein